jgi:hypothetical protein
MSSVVFEQPANMLHGIEAEPVPCTGAMFWKMMHDQRRLHRDSSIAYAITQHITLTRLPLPSPLMREQGEAHPQPPCQAEDRPA